MNGKNQITRFYGLFVRHKKVSLRCRCKIIVDVKKSHSRQANLMFSKTFACKDNCRKRLASRRQKMINDVKKSILLVIIESNFPSVDV